MVLAAGLGMRMRPLTAMRPKPLMPLWGVPLLERALRMLEGLGVREIMVNTHWLPDHIERFLRERSGTALTLTSHEPEILGTGGALRPCRAFFGSHPFWIVNSDIAASGDVARLLDVFGRGGSLAAAWLEPERGPRTVEVDYMGRITNFRSPTPGVVGTHTFCGVQVVSPRIFDFFPEKRSFSIVEAYERAMMEGLFVSGVELPGSFWADAGSVEAYLRVHRDTVNHAGFGLAYPARGDVKTFACVSEGARVGERAVIKNSVVLDGATILPDSMVDRCVVAGGTLGGRHRDAVYLSAALCGSSAVAEAARALGWDTTEAAAQLVAARGSGREFWRMSRDHSSVMVIVAHDGERPENRRYAGHARLLAEVGVPVPKVLAELPGCGTIVMEDCGDDSLLERMRKNPGRALQYYTPVVRALALMHGEGARTVLRRGVELEPLFDRKLFAWEHRLFEDFMVKERFGLAGMPEDAAWELGEIAGLLLEAPRTLLHRDMQSSNVLFKGESPVFIDFQGMRLGPAAYDLASLLYDPYVEIPAGVPGLLLGEYALHTASDTVGELRAQVHVAAVQRLVQACGAYGRLAGAGQRAFAGYIMPGLERLLEAAEICGYEALRALTKELIARERMRVTN